MNLALSPLNLILIFSASAGIFSSFSLFLKRKPVRREHVALMLLTLALVSQILKYILLITKPELLPHRFYLTSYAFIFLFGPLILFYVKEHTRNRFTSLRGFAYHLIPSLILGSVILLAFQQSTISSINSLAAQNRQSAFFIFMFITGLGILHLLRYLILSLKELRQYRDRLKLEFSDIHKISLHWLQTLISMIIIVISAICIYYLLIVFGEVYVAQRIGNTIGIISVSLITLILAYKGHTDTQVEFQTEILNPFIKKPKQTSVLLYRHLLKVMSEEKPYLNSELRLMDLSKLTSIKHHQLSELINGATNSNFFDFINDYRIQDVKQRLNNNDGERINILSIAFEAGFNSKSAFNRAFKKKEGVSPTEYFKTHRKP